MWDRGRAVPFECNPCRFKVNLRRRPRLEINLPPADHAFMWEVADWTSEGSSIILHIVSLDNMVIVWWILKPSYRYSARLPLHDTMSDATRSSSLYHKRDKDGLMSCWRGCHELLSSWTQGRISRPWLWNSGMGWIPTSYLNEHDINGKVKQWLWYSIYKS